jgi:uncharacterized protein
MIIQFTVGNFRSFNDKRTLSFERKGISELRSNLFSIGKYNLLRSIVIYGANSSGKSNLIKALERMRELILSSVKLNDSDELDYSPFLLSTQNENKSTFFEIIFIQDSFCYRYGFEYNLTEITKEWLFQKKDSKSEKTMFLRTTEGIAVSDEFEEGIGKETSTNDNRLFISLVAQLGGEISKKIIDWFKGYNVISGLDHKDYNGFTTRMLHKKLDGYDESLNLFKTLKLGFKEIKTEELEFNQGQLPKDLPEKLKTKIIKELSGKMEVSLNTIHYKYDKNGNVISTEEFDKDEMESEGTNKLIDLSGPIFDTLNLGKILIIDELDAKLHPLITAHLINLFNNPNKNPNNAQLLFATHDTNLLGNDIFRRDQVWFTEKDEKEATDLYSLYDFNLPNGSKVRNDTNVEKNYIRGRYGAIPFITN